jgi:hypothetical protein
MLKGLKIHRKRQSIFFAQHHNVGSNNACENQHICQIYTKKRIPLTLERDLKWGQPTKN